MIDLDNGDFLTFASIASAVGVEVNSSWHWKDCEVTPGIYIRHPELQDSQSRSDISRDGYMGVLFNQAMKGDTPTVQKIRKAGLKRRWTMGIRGDFDYINIWPLVPILYAFKWRWMPTIPTLCTPLNNQGFRAHLLALTVCIERSLGKKRWSHKQAARGLMMENPRNPWFRALSLRITGDSFGVGDEYHWGGCPPELHEALTEWTLEKMP